MRSTTIKPERRFFPLTGIQVRAAGDGAAPLIAGHAAVFNALSDDMGGFREQISPGAFKRTLKSADVRALFNHDPNYVLGRNQAKTLSLAEDLEGLAIQVEPPATAWASDLMTSMQRGDIDQMSFAFRTIKDKWESGEAGMQVRTLLEVELYDVSVVTYPAYPQTDAAVRSFLAAHELPAELTADVGSISDALTLLEQRGDSPQPGHSLAMRKRRVELIERSHGLRVAV